jgi:hypothetical protein
MNEADWIILRLLKKHTLDELYDDVDFINASFYLKKKYGVKKVIKSWKLLDKEKNDQIQAIIDEVWQEHLEILKKARKL